MGGTIFRHDLRGVLVEAEVHFHVNHDRHRFSISLGWIKLPSLDRRNRFLVQAHTQCPLNANVRRVAFLIDDEPEHSRSLILCLAGWFRISGIGI